MHISRHTVVCRVAKKASTPHHEYIDRKKKKGFSHICSSVIPHPIGTKFGTEVPARKGSLHINFKENRPSHF